MTSAQFIMLFKIHFSLMSYDLVSYYYILVKQYVSAHYTILLYHLGRQKHGNIKNYRTIRHVYFQTCIFCPM